MLRNVWIGLIVTGLALRYFYVAHQWRRSVELRAAARVHALQARIRPHFLFNSMNTIAALTRSNPARAEEAVQDLADLFRATLSDKHDTITLAEELEVARTYQRIEQLRLGARLRGRLEDRLAARAGARARAHDPAAARERHLPRHRAARRGRHGDHHRRGHRATWSRSSCATRWVPRPGLREGNRLALANIRERLALMYGERALMKSGRFDAEYIVTLRFPLIERPAPALAAQRA